MNTNRNSLLDFLKLINFFQIVKISVATTGTLVPNLVLLAKCQSANQNARIFITEYRKNYDNYTTLKFALGGKGYIINIKYIYMPFAG